MKNVGKTDKVIRYIIGVILIVAGIVLQVTTGGFWWLGLIGLVSIFTAVISFCLLYLPFKITTRKE